MEIIFYLLVFLLVYWVYYYFVLRRKDKIEKFKESTEMKYLQSRYQLDLTKIDAKRAMRLIAINNALIITITLLIIDAVESYLWKFLVAFVVVVSMQLIGFHILGKYLKRGEKNV